MDARLAKLLQCPVCSAPFKFNDDEGRRNPAGLACDSGHSFDRARQGYFNLLTGRGNSFVPDTAQMVAAREDFLGAGYYGKLADGLAEEAIHATAGIPHPAVLDAGAGTGYYLHRILQQLPQARAMAMDISKFALRRAAISIPDALSFAWDVWRPLPIPDGSIDVVVNVFAPRNAEEFARVLSPGGKLLVVTPLPGHLAQIRSVASLLDVPQQKAGQLNRTLGGCFTPGHHHELEIPLSLSPGAIRQAALMGPAAHHLDQAALDERLQKLPPQTAVTAAFRLSVYSALQH